MPFRSRAQARAAFAGALGSQMRERAEAWVHETPGGVRNLPEHVGPRHIIYAPHALNPRDGKKS